MGIQRKHGHYLAFSQTDTGIHNPMAANDGWVYHN
jgi:hypothetical protein